MKENIPHNHVIEQVPVDYYQKGVKNNFFQKFWHIKKLTIVGSLIPFTPRKILDVGCASGWFLSNIAKKYPKAKCFGIDIYKEAVLYGKKRYPKMSFRQADGHRIPFANNSFDLVICTEVLEHVENPNQMLLEIKRVLSEKGVAIIELDSASILFTTVWFLWTKIHGKVWKHAHLHSFNPKKLERLLKNSGFEIKRKQTFTWGMAMVFLVEKK
ncbi:MAG: class I SAM-dependent methyltransferase [Candidatus Levyibacteriota bacterium]